MSTDPEAKFILLLMGLCEVGFLLAVVRLCWYMLKQVQQWMG